jgi:hypothetical protein
MSRHRILIREIFDHRARASCDRIDDPKRGPRRPLPSTKHRQRPGKEVYWNVYSIQDQIGITVPYSTGLTKFEMWARSLISNSVALSERFPLVAG